MSLRLKMIMGICLLFGCMLAAMNIFISGYIQTSNETIITGQLTEMYNNGQVYARQFLAVNDKQSDAAGFELIAQDTVNELANATGNATGAYSSSGKLLAASRDGVFQPLKFDDLQKAVHGDSAFTLDTTDGKTVAYFSFPVTVDGSDIGIIRSIVDCSTLYVYGNNMMHTVSIITATMFFVALLISIFFIQSISSPIIKLTAISGTVANNIEQNKFNVSSIDSLLKSKRRDEVGRLSRNFSNMIRKIDQQMGVISADRQELQRLADYRKEFYDTVTHELKSPLTSIGGYAEVLEENGFTDKKFFDKGIGHIKQESARMYGMVVALLEMSRLSSSVNYPKETMDFSALVEETCEGMQFKAEKYETRIACSIAQGIRVFGSPSKLKEVLINLTDNAIKYKRPEGDINVIVRERGSMAQISVINSADPIPETELPKLFDPFYRVNSPQQREEGSRGLGLAICKQIVDQHAGKIQMRNLPGGNIAVEVLLPVYTGL
jgi:signal transduction histidine kinase